MDKWQLDCIYIVFYHMIQHCTHSHTHVYTGGRGQGHLLTCRLQLATDPLIGGRLLYFLSHTCSTTVCALLVCICRPAPTSMTVGHAWPSAPSLLSTTPPPSNWNTTPGPSTPTEPSASRSVHVSLTTWTHTHKHSHKHMHTNIHCLYYYTCDGLTLMTQIP